MPKKDIKDERQTQRGMTAVWGLALLTAVLAYMVTRCVYMYGDDYFYATFTQNGWDGYWAANRDHYLYANGRALVHALDALSLMLPPIVWRVLCAVGLGSIVALGMKVVYPQRGECSFFEGLCGGAVLTSVILYMDIRLTNQSVYWQTGSWNYVFPFVLLLLTWYLLARRRSGKGNPILLSFCALISAATTEQNAMMTIGLFVLYLADEKWVRKKKTDRAVWIALFFAILGACSVLAAPSQWSRYADEQQKLTEMTTAQLVVYNLKQLLYDFFLGDYICPYQMMFLGATMIFAFSASKGMRIGWNIFLKLYGLCGIAAMGAVLRGAGIPFEAMMDSIGWVALIAFYELIGMILLFWIMLYQKPKGYMIPITAVILAVGSQAMMLISPMLGPRTSLCAVFCMGLYTAYMAVRFLPFQNGKNETKVLWVLLSALMLVHAGRCFLPTVRGYGENAPIHAENQKQIEQYRQNGGNNLVQYTMKDDRYGWSYPYISAYHENWYRIYYHLPKELVIDWTDKVNQAENSR